MESELTGICQGLAVTVVQVGQIPRTAGKAYERPRRLKGWPLESGVIMIAGLLVFSFFITRHMRSAGFKPAL